MYTRAGVVVAGFWVGSRHKGMPNGTRRFFFLMVRPSATHTPLSKHIPSRECLNGRNEEHDDKRAARQHGAQ